MKRTLAAALALLLLCGGCEGSAPLSTPAPGTDTPGGSAVQTDWSALAPYVPEQPLYTRRYEGFVDTLIPADNYGPLTYYLGDRVGGLEGEGNRYGLMTLEGEIVTDPVFSQVWQGADFNGPLLLPYMMIQRAAVSSSEHEWPDQGLWAMCALDGSWCTEFRYALDEELLNWGVGYTRANGDQNGIFALNGSALVYLDGSSGKERFREERSGEEYPWELLYTSHWLDGMVYYMADEAYMATDPATGAKIPVSEAEMEALMADRQPEEPPVEGFWTCDKVTGTRYIYSSKGDVHGLYDEDGGLIAAVTLRGGWGSWLRLTGGMLQITAPWGSGLQDLDGNWIFRYPLLVGEWD